MPLYRIKKAGYFIGKYYAEGTELNLNEKQAKYALMSGQLEQVGGPSKPAPKAKKAGPITPITPKPPQLGRRRVVLGSTYRPEASGFKR
jgi:hypothetical protein